MQQATTSIGVLFYIIAGLVFSFSLFLLILGLRGKRINDHPICRKCKFDLFARDESNTTCPECGHDLTQPNATRLGERRKRKVMTTFASLLMLLSLSGLGIMAYSDATNVNWQQYKPVWWLLQDAAQQPGTTSDNALAELRRRYDASELSKNEINSIIQIALIHQADVKRPWQFEWGNFLEQARQDGFTTDAQWSVYLENIIDNIHTLSTRPQIVPGIDLVPIKVSRSHARMGDIYPVQELWLRQGYATTTIGPYSKEVTSTSGGSISSHSKGSSTDYLSLREADWETLKPGTYTVVHEFDISLFEDHTHEDDESLALLAKRIRLETTLELLPPDQTTATTFSDPTYRQQVEDAITLRHIRSGQWEFQKGTDKHHLDLSFNITERLFPITGTTETSINGNTTESSTKLQPIDIAFDIILRHGDNEYPAGNITAASSTNTGYSTGANINADLTEKRVDLILRPSLERAESSIDCFNIWGKEIIFEDVLIQAKP